MTESLEVFTRILQDAAGYYSPEKGQWGYLQAHRSTVPNMHLFSIVGFTERNTSVAILRPFHSVCHIDRRFRLLPQLLPGVYSQIYSNVSTALQHYTPIVPYATALHSQIPTFVATVIWASLPIDSAGIWDVMIWGFVHITYIGKDYGARLKLPAGIELDRKIAS